MIIALLTTGLLIVGLIGSNEFLSQQASSPKSKDMVASETAIQVQNPAPIMPPVPAPTEVITPTVPLHTLVTAEEAPAQQEEQLQADTVRPMTPPKDASGGSVLVENDDNFDEWAK